MACLYGRTGPRINNKVVELEEELAHQKTTSGGGGGGRAGHDPGRGQAEPPKKSNRFHQVKINLDGTTQKTWQVIKDEFAWLSGLQHVSIPASKDHIYLTFDNREHAIAARDQLTGVRSDRWKSRDRNGLVIGSLGAGRSLTPRAHPWSRRTGESIAPYGGSRMSTCRACLRDRIYRD